MMNNHNHNHNYQQFDDKQFKIPPTSSSLVSSSSPPVSVSQSSAATMVIMRPPPPPPLKITTKINPDLIKKEEPTSSIPDLEFDGMTVLCRVCGDKASGFHYGVHSCEGCKGFFRRSIQQKIQYRPCTKNQQCSILRINRNRCQYCRLKKCIVVGMSRDAVRFGRVPKREKARILAAMQQSSNSRYLEKAFCAELEDEQRLLSTVVRAHLDTCDFTRVKIEPMLIQAREDPSYTVCPPTLACPLNPNPQPLTGQQELLQDFSKRFSPAIRGVVEFAKLIPGFALLAQDDQVTLLKAGVFEVLLVRLACLFDSESNSMVCLNGQVLKRESIQNSANARFLIDSMFDFAERMNAMNLTDVEIALFCAIVVIAMDRPGLRHAELIEKMHTKLKHLLLTILKQNRLDDHNAEQVYNELLRKIPDLRTLNTLHSEKLLAFKMTEQQQQQQQQKNWPKNNNNNNNWQNDHHIDEVKSPLGSVSSTESYSGDLIENAPLLAASLSGSNVYNHRDRSHSGSGSTSSSGGDDDIMGNTTHLIQNGLTITPVIRRVVNNNVSSTNNNNNNHNSNSTTVTTITQVANTTTIFRKIDSPSDSGIESGTEKFEKTPPTNGTSSTNTSLCSSPRSSLDDHSEAIIVSKCPHLHHQYHQKSQSQQQIDDMPVLKRVLQAPPLYDTNSLMDEAYKPHKKFRAFRTVTPATSPVVVKKEIVEADTIPEREQKHQIDQPLAQQQQRDQKKSSLSSTHSTLAKSLMESPKLTPEQRKRTDIIHEYIMQGDFLNSYSLKKHMKCSSSSSVDQKPQLQSQPQQTNVIMNARTYSPNAAIVNNSSSPKPASQSPHSTSATSNLNQQPLNLSKKSPSPSPAAMVLSMEA